MTTAMDSTKVVDAARKSLGPVGAYLPVPFTSSPPVDLQREAVGRLERAGYPMRPIPGLSPRTGRR